VIGETDVGLEAARIEAQVLPPGAGGLLVGLELVVEGAEDQKSVAIGRIEPDDLFVLRGGLAQKFGLDISVATGGTLARKVIVEKRPQLVIAVACERDLTSGIKDCYPLPVIGILNDRPNGPCVDTSVDVAKIEQALLSVLPSAS